MDLRNDETRERRWGRTISTRGHCRDRALSRRKPSVSRPGWRWMVRAVVGTRPWTRQRWALPCFGVLTTSPDVSAPVGKGDQTVAMWAPPMIRLGRHWLPDCSLKLMGETASRVRDPGRHAHAQHVTLVTTGRVDAVLHEPPPERTSHTIGRPRVVGTRLPAREHIFPDPETVWQKRTRDGSEEGERCALAPPGGTALALILCLSDGSGPVSRRASVPPQPSCPLTPLKQQNRSCAMSGISGIGT
ncbi:MAG TPA: hypothetical protein VGF67_19505 [Ktedonobacteraceae bacterium]